VEHCIGTLLGKERSERGTFAEVELLEPEAPAGDACKGIDGPLVTTHQGVHGHHAGGIAGKKFTDRV
jgi:hypothetical protein